MLTQGFIPFFIKSGKAIRGMGNHEDSLDRDYDLSRKIFLVGFVLAAISGMLMCILMLIWVFVFTGGVTWGTNIATEINLHVILMTLFMVYLQGYGAIIFRCLPSRPKIQIKLVHAGFHLVTLIAVSMGLWNAVNAHNMKGQRHFFTLHSWIGIIAIGLFYGQFLAGIFLLPYIPMRIPNIVIPFHKVLGPLIFISSCIATATGMMMKALGALSNNHDQMPPAAYTINFAAMFLLLFCLTVTYLVLDHRFSRKPRPDRAAQGNSVDIDDSPEETSSQQVDEAMGGEEI